MRRVLSSVAMSLDGFIAGPGGEDDWIPEEPAIDFAAFFARFDATLMGRRTDEVASKTPGGLPPGLAVRVSSRTLSPGPRADGSIVDRDAESVVARLRGEPGKALWLMGGGDLFRNLLEAGLVDEVEVAVVPILLGDEIPPLHPTSRCARLELVSTRCYPSGIVSLAYRVRPEATNP